LKVQGVSGAKAITVGNEHSCTQTANGTVLCWGHNNLGQLGDKQAEAVTSLPVQVQGL
jgi:alpha-tubulin suppressor-like RCC1 family protein